MNNISTYFVYFIIYGYIFLLFLKGYYPANETGILFIGFLIFMTLAYKFAGSLINDELSARRRDIYNKFENLLEQNYVAISHLKNVHLNILSQKNLSSQYISNFLIEFQNDSTRSLDNGISNNVRYVFISQLFSIVKSRLSLINSNIEVAYTLAVKQLLDNKLENK